MVHIPQRARPARRISSTRVKLLLLGFAVLLLALGLAPIIPYYLPKGDYEQANATANPPLKQLRIIYFDSLYVDFPNRDLLNLVKLLKTVHNVSVYLGENATVAQLMEIIRSGNFDVLIIRAHSAPMETGSPFEKGIAIFGERADEEKYFIEQLAGLVRRARPLWGVGVYYALTPLAFEGLNFSNKIVILLSCGGFDDYMPGVIAGGGGIYASWTGFVSVEGNDKVAKSILIYLLNGRHPLYGVIGVVDSQYGSKFLAAAPRRNTAQ
ncbi:MAG: hypothetical protein QW680_07805 [Pyrobaculum sp.]